MQKGKGAGAAWRRLRKLPACLTEEDHVLQSAKWVAERMYKAGRNDGRDDLEALARYGWAALNFQLGRCDHAFLDTIGRRYGLFEEYEESPKRRLSRAAFECAVKLES